MNNYKKIKSIKPFDFSKLFKDFRGIGVLNKKYRYTERRNVTERLRLSEGEFLYDLQEEV